MRHLGWCLAAAAITALTTTAATAAADPAYDAWAAKHASAARALTALVGTNPRGAAKFAEWGSTYPDEAKQAGEYLKAHPTTELSDVADQTRSKQLAATCGEATLFSMGLDNWIRHNTAATTALFSDPAAMKAALTAPPGTQGNVLGALSAGAPPMRESDDKYAEYQKVTMKELPARGGMHGKLGAEFLRLAAAEYADQEGQEVVKAYLYGATWDLTVDALGGDLPRHRNVKGIVIIRKDKTKCMAFFDSLSQEWDHRDLLGRDYWKGNQYSMDDKGRFKIDCAAVK